MKPFSLRPSARSLIFTVVVVVVLLVSIRLLSEGAFWNDFLSNLLSTVIGIGVGVPVAVLISEWQESTSTRERTQKMLSLLVDELQLNYIAIDNWLKKSDDITVTISLNILLRDELWSTFSDGGEIQWIKDLGLLANLADSYHQIRSLKTLTGRLIDELGENYPVYGQLLPEVSLRANECKGVVDLTMSYINDLGVKETMPYPRTLS